MAGRPQPPKKCPYCKAVVVISHCGYSSFNPGSALCTGCKRGWKLGWVIGQAEAIQKWNRAQKYLVRMDELKAELKKLTKKAGV